jgi:two-component system cell cycle sensor histidine kinase/response regulator CckA
MMLYNYVSIGYSATNLLLALIIYFKSAKSLIVKFYLFLVVSIVFFGACGYLATTRISTNAGGVITAVGSFLFALFPFFFLHFMIIMVRREELLQSPFMIGLVYFAGIFSYTLELLGLIPKPITVGVGLSSIGYVFLITWMSVIFSVGIALLFTFLKGFSDKGMKSNVIIAGFALLLLILPGPFTESILMAFFPKNTDLYMFASLLALVLALYFVFRHKIIVNTLYDAMRSALTFMNDVLFKTDDELNIQFVRGGTAEVLEYKENDLVGRNLLEFIPQEEVLRSYKEKAIEGKEEDVVVDIDFITKTGQSVPLNLSMTTVVETGQIVGFVGIGRDTREKRRSELMQAALYRISEIMRTTESLSEFCKSIHAVINQLIPSKSFYIALRDETGQSLSYPYYVNEVYETVDSQVGLDAFNNQVLMSGGPSSFTTDEKDESASNAGRKMPLDWFGVPLKTASGTIGVLGIQSFSPTQKFTDADKNLLSLLSEQIAVAIEKKRSDEKIREQAALLDKSQDAIIVETLDGTITFWNEGASNVYGWTSSEVVGRKARDIFRDDVPVDDVSARDAVLRYGEWSGKLEGHNRRMEEMIVDCRWKLLKDDQGNPKSIMKVCTDVTEKMRLENQFLRAQRLESIGTLAGGIAHDLNNVLAPIMMSVKALRRRLNDENGERILDTIETSAKRGAEMVRQVLMFGRGVKGERVVIQPRHVIRELINMAYETFPKSIKIEHSLPKDLWPIVGDATQIHQILLNLCVNARDAMPDGGTLMLSAENIVLGEDYAKTNLEAKPGKYVQIVVSDTGTGIPPNLLDKIFEPFFTTKEPGKGTGLGLSTTLALVKAHGGFVTVYSEVNRGSTFKVYFPAEEMAEVETPVEFDYDKYVGHGETILVVDDESSIREIARATLEAYGYKVLTAADGAEAIAVFVKNMDSVKVIIVDNMMPVLDGKSAAAALKRMETAVKIIATSGLQEEVVGPFADQTDAFISKPFTGEKLLKTVYEVLNED